MRNIFKKFRRKANYKRLMGLYIARENRLNYIEDLPLNGQLEE